MQKKFANLALAALSVVVFTGSISCSQAAEKESIVEVTDETADQEISNEKKPVFIDFYTTWCGPCKMQSPILDELSEEYKETIKFVKVDAEKSPILAQKYDIMAYPTMKFVSKKFKNGKSLVGFNTKEKVKTFLDRALKESKPAKNEQ